MTIQNRLATLTAGVLCLTAAASAQNCDLQSLYSLYNSDRGDYFTTSDPAWKAAGIGDFVGSPAYRMYRVEGDLYRNYVPGTLALALWYNGHDNYSTTGPVPTAFPGDAPYFGHGILGFVFDPARPQPRGTVRLFSLRSASRRDYLVTTDERWRVSPPGPDYVFNRDEGFIFPSSYDVTGLNSLYGGTDNYASTNPLLEPGPGQVFEYPYAFYRREGRLFKYPFSMERYSCQGAVRALDPPAGTVPLLTWYSADRHDHFTTSDPRWRGAAPPVAGYVYQGTIGYVFDPMLPQPANTIPLFSLWGAGENDNFLTTDRRYWGSPGQRVAGDYVFVRLEGYIFDVEILY